MHVFRVWKDVKYENTGACGISVCVCLHECICTCVFAWVCVQGCPYVNLCVTHVFVWACAYTCVCLSKRRHDAETQNSPNEGWGCCNLTEFTSDCLQLLDGAVPLSIAFGEPASVLGVQRGFYSLLLQWEEPWPLPSLPPFYGSGRRLGILAHNIEFANPKAVRTKLTCHLGKPQFALSKENTWKTPANVQPGSGLVMGFFLGYIRNCST